MLTDMLKQSGRIPAHNHGGRQQAGVEAHLLAAIDYFANQQSYRLIAVKFGLTESMVHKAVRRVTSWLISITKIFIRWPSAERQIQFASEFAKKGGIDGVIGAIDGSHFNISALIQNPEDYVNRKSRHSLNLQAIVDPDMMFTDVYCGEPGTLHDARVLRKSPLYQQCINDSSKLFDANKRLVGESAYPRLDWLLPPNRDNCHLSASQRDFNYRHSRTRIVVERAFGLLKGRFRRLQHVEMKDTKEIPRIILACCVLHNICLLNDKDISDMVDVD